MKNKILSWDIYPDELKNQVENYDALKMSQSYRGRTTQIMSVLLGLAIILSLFRVLGDLLTVLMVVAVFSLFMYFVNRGHNRWPIIGMMFLWTFDRVFQFYSSFESSNGSIIRLVTFFWWIIIMGYMVKTLKVEKELLKYNKLVN